MGAMPRQRFLAVWIGFTFLYLLLTALGPEGLLSTGIWPRVNQHLLQVRAWRGEDILVPDESGTVGRVIPISPRLDVTPYFENWVMEDPRERVLMSNIACGVQSDSPDRALEQLRYLPTEQLLAELDLERMVCHVGFPLGPSLVLAPLRMILGSMVATQWVAAVLGGLAVALMDLLLLWWLEFLSGVGTVSGRERGGLLVLTGLGTLWLWLVPQPEVWFFAQTVATAALALALVLAWRRHWLWSGLAFAVAFTSRTPTLLALPMLLAVLLHQSGSGSRLGGPSRRSRMRALALAAFFPLLLGAGHLVLNAARFGSIWDFGYRFMLTPPTIRQALEQHGTLSPSFFTTNFRYLFLQPPVLVVDPDTGAASFPYLASDPYGMGLFFVTPAMIAVFLAAGGTRRSRGLIPACWLSLTLVSLPALFYFNTGWVQWGGRYLLDAWPLWLMLTAIGLRRINSRIAGGLILASVVSNLWAAVLKAGGWWP
jgi:hypothetical protein